MKTLIGKIVSLKMQKTAVVEVVERRPHPLYKKLIKKSKKFKADTNEIALVLGDTVKMVEVRPISKDKHFKIQEVIKIGGDK